MRRSILPAALLLLAVLVLGACGGSGDGGAAAAGGPAATTANGEVVVELAEQNGSGESGTATLTAMLDRTRVVLELSNPTTPSQPAHFHEGRCGPELDPQPLHGLLNVMDGRSETVVDAPLAELTSGGLAINVHQSDADLDTWVACGNVPGPGDGSSSSDEGGLGY